MYRYTNVDTKKYTSFLLFIKINRVFMIMLVKGLRYKVFKIKNHIVTNMCDMVQSKN